MSVGDLLSGIGRGVATAGRVAGTVLEPIAKRTAEVVSGEAPELDAERRQQAMQLTDQQRELKANDLESQLEMGRKYGTLTPEQQKQYVDQITGLYSNPEQQGSLLQRIHKALHPTGTVRQAAQPLPSAVPEGGTAGADEAAREREAQARYKPNIKNFRNTKTGDQMAWDANEGTPGPGWILTGTSTGFIRQGSHVLNPPDAVSLLNSGMATFRKQDGENWTAKEMENFPPGIVLAQFIEGDQTFYAPVNQRTKTATWDNQVHQINEAGQIDPDTSTHLGAARVPTVQTQTAPGGGQVVTQTTTPVTPGKISPRPAAPVAPTAGAKPINGGGAGAILRKAQLASSQSVMPNIQNMTPRNAALAQKTQPAVSALLGIYGDPQNPSTPSLMGYAKLADDPHSQKVLGEAFKLLDQQMGEISDPGIIQTLGTAAGWANFRAQAESGAQQAAGTAMTPQEKEYFDTAIASMADIIGARAATGQSPARFSVRAMQNELPLIGLSGTSDEASYLTKLETIARQVGVGLNAMPDNSRAVAWLAKRQADIAKQKAGLGKSKVGDTITQNGQKFKVKAVDASGKVTAADPIP